jgi:hypothetical protein
VNKIVALSLLIATVLFCQPTLAPSVVDNGGGIVNSGGYKLVASIGQAVAGGSGNRQFGYITANITLTGIKEPANRATTPVVKGFYPNPFNSSTRIEVLLSKNGTISLGIFDLSGKQVFDWNETKNAGDYELTFTPTGSMNSGIYFYKMTIGDSDQSVSSSTGKIVFIK